RSHQALLEVRGRVRIADGAIEHVRSSGADGDVAGGVLLGRRGPEAVHQGTPESGAALTGIDEELLDRSNGAVAVEGRMGEAMEMADGVGATTQRSTAVRDQRGSRSTHG